jgi:hypothetical protein|tara:strand:+ start:11796 stop:12248 length:453 start_codon:yes stop_codon:yes gene_type:complete
MANDLSGFLDTTPGDTPDPILLPEGTYGFVFKSYRADEVGENQNTKVTVRAQATDVVESDLDDGDLEHAKPVRLEYWATERALAHDSSNISLKAYLRTVLDMSSTEMEELPYSQLLEMAIGQTFKGVVKHEMVGKNKDILIASVARVLAA